MSSSWCPWTLCDLLGWFTGTAAAKNRPRSGNAVACCGTYATINLSEEGEENTFAHVTPVANGEESTDAKVAGTGGKETTQHSTRRKHRPPRSMLRHGTQQSTSRPRRPRILGTTAVHRQRNGGHAWKGAQEDGRNKTMQQSTRQGTEHGVRDRRLPPRRPVRTTGGYRGGQREQSDNDKEDDDGASRQGGRERRRRRAVVRRQLEGGMARSLC